jgi:ssDNA-binding Zn-finger/Zn-ribbon topoisomerase 1
MRWNYRPCPLCAAPLIVYRNGRNGRYFWGCSAYPACEYTARRRGVRPGNRALSAVDAALRDQELFDY